MTQAERWVFLSTMPSMAWTLSGSVVFVTVPAMTPSLLTVN